MPMLDIKNLTLEMQSSEGAIKALDKVNLSVNFTSKQAKEKIEKIGGKLTLIKN